MAFAIDCDWIPFSEIITKTCSIFTTANVKRGEFFSETDQSWKGDHGQNTLEKSMGDRNRILTRKEGYERKIRELKRIFCVAVFQVEYFIMKNFVFFVLFIQTVRFSTTLWCNVNVKILAIAPAIITFSKNCIFMTWFHSLFSRIFHPLCVCACFFAPFSMRSVFIPICHVP